MSCQYYQSFVNEDGVTYPAGWYESEDSEACVPTVNQLQSLMASPLPKEKNWFEKNFLDETGKLNSTGIAAVAVTGLILVVIIRR